MCQMTIFTCDRSFKTMEIINHIIISQLTMIHPYFEFILLKLVEIPTRFAIGSAIFSYLGASKFDYIDLL